jgi:hypothetical protein
MWKCATSFFATRAYDVIKSNYITMFFFVIFSLKLFACKSCSLLTHEALTYLYGGVLLSTPLHASSNFTVSVQLANKKGLI